MTKMQRKLRRLRKQARQRRADRRKRLRRLKRRATNSLAAWGFHNDSRVSISTRVERLMGDLYAQGRQHHVETGEHPAIATRYVFQNHIRQRHRELHKYQRHLRNVQRCADALWLIMNVAKFQRRVLRWLWRPGGGMARRASARFTGAALELEEDGTH